MVHASSLFKETKLSAQWQLSAPFSHCYEFIYLGNASKENSPSGQEVCETQYGFNFS